MSSVIEAIVWQEGKIVLLEQTQIPVSENYLSYVELALYLYAIQRLDV